MKQSIYKSFEEFRNSNLFKSISYDTTPKINMRVLRSIRLEDMIYRDLREQIKIGLDEAEAEGSVKLDTFSSLLQDVFQSLYSPNPKHNDVETLTVTTRRFNAEIINFIMSSDKYPAVKSLCEGQELLAYEAVHEFAKCMLDKLDELLNTDNGSNAADVLNTLESQQDDLKSKLLAVMESGDPADEGSILSMASNIASIEQQIERLTETISKNIHKNSDVVQAAIVSSGDMAQEASAAVKSWGNGDSSPEALRQNTELLRRVKSSPKLRDIMKYFGKYREILDSTRKTSFTYGRGEKYDIVLGNDFTRAVSSEYAYLALPETIPLFIQKVQRKALKQYRKRERTNKGYGDIVVCIDESGSMEGESIAWAKAIALALLEYTAQHKRSCAMVRFASENSTQTHLYQEGKYTTEDIFLFAESFLNGGTDFETPLTKAVELIKNEGYENADIVFITDGECDICDEFACDFREQSVQLKFNVKGILIDTDESDMAFSLESFCEKVYRLSELTGDDIAADIIRSKYK